MRMATQTAWLTTPSMNPGEILEVKMTQRGEEDVFIAERPHRTGSKMRIIGYFAARDKGALWHATEGGAQMHVGCKRAWAIANAQATIEALEEQFATVLRLPKEVAA